MKRLNLLLVFIILTVNTSISIANNVRAKLDIPDFNYPRTVIADAEKGLKSALKNGDGKATIKYLVQSSLAQSMINPDSAQLIINRIDSIAMTEQDAVTRSLLYHFEAYMLNTYYQRNKYIISERKAVAGVTDINEWSCIQFEDKIIELVDKSIDAKSALLSTPIDALGNLVKYNENTHILYPTLYDMICWISLDMLQNNYSKNYREKVTQLYTLIKDAHTQEYGPYINAVTSELQYNGCKLEELQTVYDKYVTVTDMAYLAIYSYNEKNEKEKYRIYQDFIKRYPESVYAPNIKSKISYLEDKKDVAVYFKDEYTTADSIKLEIIDHNVNDLNVYIYCVPSNISDMHQYKGNFSSLRYISSIPVHTDSIKPFYDTIKITLKPLAYGKYFVFCDAEPSSPKSLAKKLEETGRWNMTHFTVTDINLFSATTKDNECRVFAVNAKTGKPIKDITITAKNTVKRTTNKDGYVTFSKKIDKKLKWNNFEVSAVYGNDAYAKLGTSFSRTLKDQNIQAKIFTDLAIYHPGDTVNVSMLCYNSSERLSVVPDKKIRLIFFDSNFEPIDTISSQTNEMGQVSVQFVTPRDRMNGNFCIYAQLLKDDNKYTKIASHDITISEYKVPSFYIDINSKRTYEQNKDITISGKALNYVGIPVANAKLSAELSVHEWTWSRHIGSKNHISSFRSHTNNNGGFSITIPKDSLNIDYSDYAFELAQYSINISVTSETGETQSAEKYFQLGSHNEIISYSNDMCYNADNLIKLPIKVKSFDATAKLDCKYIISDTSSKSIVSSGTFASDSAVISLSDIKSGKYQIKISAPDADDFISDIELFHTSDDMPPVESPLWMPECGRTVNKNNDVAILLGNSNTDSHIYCMAISRNKVITDGWMDLKPGMHTLKYRIPQNEYDFIDFVFVTSHKGTMYSKEFRLYSQYKPNDIKIKPIAFRDNLISGSHERWTFQLENAKGKLVQGAMLCEMYDKAISQIKNNLWKFAPAPNMYSTYSTSISRIYTYSNSYHKFNSKNFGKSIYCRQPSLYTYGIYPFNPQATAFGSTTFAHIESKSASSVPRVMMKKESAEEAYLVDTGNNSLEEVVVVSDNDNDNLNDIAMRAADVQTALWKPNLHTDADGNIYIDFDAPQFNTTWIMQALAFTSDMHTAMFKKDVVTSKPIMVRANLPRFVRQGDKVNLASSLMNVTDSTQSCDAIIELFIPETGKIVATKNFSVALAPKASQALSIDWCIPDTIASIGYRIKAATSEFGDGEQTALAVLPSISPIIETKPFFIDATQKQYALNLPKFPKGSRVTLEYCDNPVWYCVTALPSIKAKDDMTATSLAHSLFALTLAEGIAKTNPDIKEAIDYWKNSEGDSTLVSSLEKNSELKISTLLASPWLQEAKRQTLRMHSISNLFDQKKTSKESEKIVNQLNELQMADGGWTWFKYRDCQSSLYVTQEVLELIGELRHLGYMTDNSSVNGMVKKAIEYYDKRTLENFNKRKNKKDYTGLSDYVYIRSLFKDFPMPLSMQRLYENALISMKKEWKGLTLPAKAYFAIALHRNGDATTARDIVESLRQFSVTTPENGMYWDNISYGWNTYFSKTAITSLMLQTFAEVEPTSKDVEQIRKWILLDKQTNDWGNSSLASDAIYAILSSGSQWLGKQSPAEITIDTSKLNNTKADRYLGYFKRAINVESANESLMSINRGDGSSPAWGAIYCQYASPMTEVKASSVDELSIEKETYIVTDNRLVKTDAMTVGDRVQVRFVIKNTRDLEYVTLTDERAACTEPVAQTSEYRYLDGIGYYQEIKDNETHLFFNYLPKGSHIITYDLYITSPGEYNVGIASIQSQYAPQITAHSKGNTIKVSNKKQSYFHKHTIIF